MVESFLSQPAAFQRVIRRKFSKDLRKNNDQLFDDPSFQSPSDEQIAKDRLIRKIQVTDGVIQLGRLFSQLSLLLCSTDFNDDKLANFRCGLKKNHKD